MLKLRDRILGPDLILHDDVHPIDFDRKLLDGQESNLKQLQKDE